MFALRPASKAAQKEAPSRLRDRGSRQPRPLTFKAQTEVVEWARKNNHAPRVTRVRHLNNKKMLDWRIP
jgi:hypothetical protein